MVNHIAEGLLDETIPTSFVPVHPVTGAINQLLYGQVHVDLVYVLSVVIRLVHRVLSMPVTITTGNHFVVYG